jgi:hypothetical protein
MAEPTPARRRAVFLVVLGVVIVALGAMLLIGILRGDDTGEIDPQNGEVVTHFLG